MSETAPHPVRPHGVGALLLTLLAWLLVGLAGLTLVVVLPFVLVLTAMGGGGGAWPIYLWAAGAFVAGFATIVVGLAAIANPRPLPVLLLLLLAAAAFLSFPPFWQSGS